MTWRDRVLHDGVDREGWLAARSTVITAHSAKGFARLESVEKYLLAKISADRFTGNSYTENGHLYEPMILAYLDVQPNTALIHAPGNPGFAATPDGLDTVLAEAKVRHGKIAPNPDAGEWKQCAWQFMCVPEAEELRFGTLTLIQDGEGAWVPRAKDALTSLVIPRDHPKITKAIDTIVPIAHEVLAALEVALRAQKEMTF